MIQRISAPVSVKVVFNHHKRLTMPKVILWEGKEHVITQHGFHHTFREGRTLFHIFSLGTDTLSLRLKLNTDSLEWWLEEITDGEPD